MGDRAIANPHGYGLGVLRHVQWLFALVCHIIFDRAFFYHVRTSLGMDGGVRAIPAMNVATLAYATAILLGLYLARKLSMSRRYGLEIISVPIDITMALLYLAKGAILNSTRLDCQVLIKDKFFQDGLNSQALKSFSKDAFGPGRLGIDDIDRQCAASMVIYWLSHIAIISYVLSILLTTLRLKQYRKIILAAKKLDYHSSPGHVEMAIESARSPHLSSSTSSFRSPGLGFPSESVRGHERPSLVDLFGAPPVTYRSRSSQETTSSYNGEAMLVCDGFRAPEEPPAYASRPGSLYSFKGD